MVHPPVKVTGTDEAAKIYHWNSDGGETTCAYGDCRRVHL